MDLSSLTQEEIAHKNPPSGERPRLLMTPTAAPASQLTVSMRLVWPFRAANQALGIQTDPLWELEGIEPSRLADANSRIPWEVAQRLLRWSEEATGVDDLGLRAALHATPGTLDLPEYAARSKPTLQDAYECIARLFPLMSDVGELVWEVDGDRASLTLHTPQTLIQHSATPDFTLALMTLTGRRFTGMESFAPREVHLARSAPRNPSRHQELFRAPVRFGMGLNRLLFHADSLRLPLQQADSHLSQLLDRVAQQLLRDTARTPTLTERVRALVAQRTGTGRASAKDIAQELGMVQRTLHRHLAQDGVTFRQLSDEVRRHLALTYLDERRLALSEIAGLLGFSGVPAFHRAFKRWTGMTPAAFRAEVLS